MTMAGRPERGDPLALDQLEGPGGVEVVHHDDLPAGAGVPHHDGVTARGVEQGHGEQIGQLPLAGGVGQGLPNRSWPLVLRKKRLIKLVQMLRWVPTAPLDVPWCPRCRRWWRRRRDRW